MAELTKLENRTISSKVLNSDTTNVGKAFNDVIDSIPKLLDALKNNLDNLDATFWEAYGNEMVPKKSDAGKALKKMRETLKTAENKLKNNKKKIEDDLADAKDTYNLLHQKLTQASDTTGNSATKVQNVNNDSDE